VLEQAEIIARLNERGTDNTDPIDLDGAIGKNGQGEGNRNSRLKSVAGEYNSDMPDPGNTGA
jgi:hypothetical protein